MESILPEIRKQTIRQSTTNHSKKPSVLDRISSISFDEDEGIKLCVYGKSGTGKTTLSATFPKPALYMICSGGNKPGELRSINTPEYRRTIKQVALESPTEALDVIEHVKQSEYKTLVLDHASGLQDMVLKEILGLDELPAQTYWGMASQQQYGQCTLQCKEILRAMLSLSCNVVVVAQEREFNTDSDVSEYLAPTVGAALSPSLTGWLNTAVDYICQTYIRQKEEEKTVTKTVDGKEKTVKTKQKVKGVEYCLRTAPDPVYTTKFRLPKGVLLPDVVVNPSYDKLMKLITGADKE